MKKVFGSGLKDVVFFITNDILVGRLAEVVGGFDSFLSFKFLF